MFHSSRNGIDQICCDRSTCTKLNQQIEDSNSQSSSLEKINTSLINKVSKETQMSPRITSSSDKTDTTNQSSEKSSEADFDRNNQNIRHINNKFYSSNSSHTSQTESQTCAVTLNCPSKLISKPIVPPKAYYRNLPEQYVFEGRHKCTCKKSANESTSSSSTSLTSEHFPVKLKSCSEDMRAYPPQSLQPQPIKIIHTLQEEQYYSCDSEESDSDEISEEMHVSPEYSKSDKGSTILDLLQEVVRSMDKNSAIREEAIRIAQVGPASVKDESNKITIKESKLKVQLMSKTTSISQLRPVPWPPHPWYCCCNYGMTAAQVPHFQFPVMEMPEKYLHNDSESFKDCASGSKSILTFDQTTGNLSCLCPDDDYIQKIPTSPCLSDRFAVECSTARLDTVPGNQPSSSLETEYVDEELHPRYVDKIFTGPFHISAPSPDSLVEYDDEEPSFPQNFDDVDDNEPDLDHTCVDCLIEYDDEEPMYLCQQMQASETRENFQDADVNEPDLDHTCVDCLIEYDDEEPIYSCEENNAPEARETTNEPNDHVEIIDKELNAIITLTEAKETEEVIQIIDEILQSAQEEASPYIETTPPTTVRDTYNLSPEIDQANDSRRIIGYDETEEDLDSYYPYQKEMFDEEDYELGKEKISERCKRKKCIDADQEPVLTTLKQPESGDSSNEMKFFIDSLILDLNAMDYARRKSQFEKNICTRKVGLCDRDSFPVTITEVTDLGASSLYVKWIIHDCFAIAGYEIYTDGYLTNRYYNSRHDSAVITQVDVTLPHKIALVAQAYSDDASLELMYNMTADKNKPKSLPCKTIVERNLKSHSALWTPSIFLYDPITCRAGAAPPIMRDNF